MYVHRGRLGYLTTPPFTDFNLTPFINESRIINNINTISYKLTTATVSYLPLLRDIWLFIVGVLAEFSLEQSTHGWAGVETTADLNRSLCPSLTASHARLGAHIN